MMLLVSGATREVAKHPHVGILVVPSSGNHPKSLPLSTRPWAIDNGAFSGFDAARYLRMLDRFHAYRNHNCLFVVAPDVVGDAAATLQQFRTWEPILHRWQWPVAFVGQDGLRLRDVPWSACDAVFLGGSTDWKLGRVARDLAAYGRARGKWVHMGRVNSKRRIHYAMRIGVQSVDGRQWSAWSRRYLPTFQKIVAPLPLFGS